MRTTGDFASGCLAFALAAGVAMLAGAQQGRGPQASAPDRSPSESTGLQPPADCEPIELGRWAERALRRDLERRFPWLTEDWAPGYPLACRDAAGRDYVQLELVPHLRRPRWELHRELECSRTGWDPWECTTPQETTVVRLAADHAGSIVLDAVPVEDALRALATVQTAILGPGIVDPFAEPDDPPLAELGLDSLLSVSREEYCGGLLVTAQPPDEDLLLELCVEPQVCEDAALDACPWTVRLQGRSGGA